MEGVIWEVIGWVGTGLVVLSMAQQRITRLRILNLGGSAILLVYNLILGVWPMVALNAALSVIQIYHLNILFRSRHDDAAYSAVTADPGDEIVSHVISQHGEEIRSFHPAFRTPTDSSIAFLVMKGDELVGLVLASVDEAGTALLDVDYVTPAYRDFTPAEFVFRRSGIWQRLGVARIRTAPGGPEYYSNLGFTARDGAWELAVTGA
ncbi:MAG: hypothetical protein ACQERF_02510 [Actinomycetota bacterium]